MGIPRLSQDLHSFAERIVIGSSSHAYSDLKSERIIIDGPSLVYFVYGRVFLHASPTSDIALPTYAEVNAALIYLLDDFNAHGVEMYVYKKD